MSTKAMEKIDEQGKKERAKKVEIIFNNYPHDTVININGNLARIEPGRINVTVKGVTDFTVTKKVSQELAMRLIVIAEIAELEKIKSVTIRKADDIDEHIVEIEHK